MKPVRFFLLLIVIFSAQCKGIVHQADTDKVVIAFYNCENFFGMGHNPLKVDTDFMTGGSYNYTLTKYEQKLRNITTVIQSINSGKGPAIMGLAEVENNSVLDDLVHQPEIARHHYKFIWFEGPDQRGINVAMLYDPVHFSELRSEHIPIDLTDIEPGAKTRDVLHVLGILDGDTVHAFVNHWPSRRGGEISAPKRMRAASICKREIDKLMSRNVASEIIFMGDFNDNPPDSSISVVLGAHAAQSFTGPGLYDPWGDFFSKGQGTEAFDHQWNLFDQIMISQPFLQNSGHKLHYEQADIYKPPFLIDDHKGRDGEPRRSFAGTHWMNGYSDHFPVILYLSKN